jgi:pimeloyl-ACP methyl ester carboxylesterase
VQLPSILNTQGERLATTYTPGAPEVRTLVLIGHGLTSDKDRPWSEALSSHLAAHGIPSLRLAFSGNGESEGRFEDSTISKEVEDLSAAVGAFPGERLAYVGHSMGGAVGTLFAARDPRLVALVTLAAVTHTAEFVTRMFGHLSPGEPMLDKPQCPFNNALRDDLLAIQSTTAAATEIRTPWLIIHGSADDVVPIQHSDDLHAAASGADYLRLESVDHSFTGDGLGAMVEAVGPWLVEQLTD